MTTAITIARGNGIGPEIMDATLKILEAAGAKLAIEEIEIGEDVYKRGVANGIEDSSWASLKKTKVFLKSPITTPQGGGFKSLNVTVRKTLGLFANVRPCVTYHPYVTALHPKMDIVIVRENEEDLYSGIEYRQTQQVAQSLKLISQPGSEKIVRYAFEYARANGRKKVTCMSKDNIMKIADGVFHAAFDAVAKEYPDIQNDHFIIDIGTARIASRPGDFDVIVTENLYGDIISDVAAEVTGSVGLAGSSNIGDDFAMFEAIHGSAPDIAGKGIANPSGLLLGAVMMLIHIGQGGVATRVHNAWLRTIEDGIHTGDIYREGNSKRRVGTADFAQAVIANLDNSPVKLPAVTYSEVAERQKAAVLKPPAHQVKDLLGTDLYLDWPQKDVNVLVDTIKPLAEKQGLTLHSIANRGMKFWPGTPPVTFTSDQWRLRLMTADKGVVTHKQIQGIMAAVTDAGYDTIKTENLYRFDGVNGFTVAQGE
ncbi:MAG: NADP-dependent isocitrate dehydrogenase [Pseudomonadota bacterium]